MSIESSHWYRVDRAEEDRCAALDAKELAIEYKADAFREHGFLWVGGDILDMDAAHELVWDSRTYAAWVTAKNEATTAAELERLAREYRPMVSRLLDVAIVAIATKAVNSELEAA